MVSYINDNDIWYNNHQPSTKNWPTAFFFRSKRPLGPAARCLAWISARPMMESWTWDKRLADPWKSLTGGCPKGLKQSECGGITSGVKWLWIAWGVFSFSPLFDLFAGVMRCFCRCCNRRGFADVLNVMNNTRSFGRTTCVWYSQRSLFEWKFGGTFCVVVAML